MRVVLDAVANVLGSGREIVTDNFFTSFALAERMLESNLFLTGTVRKSRVEVPTELLPNRSREVMSTLNVYNKNVMLASHVPKKNRAVLFLTTNPDLQSDQEENSNTKPPVNLRYNAAKAGVDNLDQATREFSFARKTSRWPLRFVYDILELSVYNAYIIYTLKNPTERNVKHSRLQFMKLLSYELATNYVQIRSKKAEETSVHEQQKRDFHNFFAAFTALQAVEAEGKYMPNCVSYIWRHRKVKLL